MKKKILITFVLLATLLFVTACTNNTSPYLDNDAKGYTVSVCYDANGGQFGSNPNTKTVVDSYNISQMSTNGNGKVELALLAPDNAIRGSANASEATRSGYFLAGWYTERIESTDSAGNTVYTYANKWDFETSRYEVDPSKEYSASEPVVTLYAAWVPLFQINFYSISDGEQIGTYSFNPNDTKEIKVPQWNEETGAMEMYKFPVRNGYTFDAAYYDEAATELVEGTVTHPGKVDEATGTAEAAVLDLYVNWIEGEWFHIYNVEQFQKNAKPNASFVLHADLDFTDEYWPTTLMVGTYTGTIQGNGHTISNVTLEQTQNNKPSIGLFGILDNTAKLSDVTFENVTFIIKSGTRTAGTTFGLLAGSIRAEAELENITIANSTLQVDADKVYFDTTDYAIGKISGNGDFGIDYSGITCQVIGTKTEIVIEEDGNTIELTFKTN